MSQNPGRNDQILNNRSSGTGSATGGPGPVYPPLPPVPTLSQRSAIGTMGTPFRLPPDIDEEPDPVSTSPVVVAPGNSHIEEPVVEGETTHDATSGTEVAPASVNTNIGEGPSATGLDEPANEDDQRVVDDAIDDNSSKSKKKGSRNPITNEACPPYEEILCAQCQQIGHPSLDCTRNLEEGYIGTKCCVIHNSSNDHRTVDCPWFKEGRLKQGKAFHHLVTKRDCKPPIQLPWWVWMIDFQKWMRPDNVQERPRPQTPEFAQRIFDQSGTWQGLHDRVYDPAWSIERDNWSPMDYTRYFAHRFPIPNEVEGVQLPVPAEQPVPRAQALEQVTVTRANQNGSTLPPPVAPSAGSNERDNERHGRGRNRHGGKGRRERGHRQRPVESSRPSTNSTAYRPKSGNKIPLTEGMRQADAEHRGTKRNFGEYDDGSPPPRQKSKSEKQPPSWSEYGPLSSVATRVIERAAELLYQREIVSRSSGETRGRHREYRERSPLRQSPDSKSRGRNGSLSPGSYNREPRPRFQHGRRGNDLRIIPGTREDQLLAQLDLVAGVAMPEVLAKLDLATRRKFLALTVHSTQTEMADRIVAQLDLNAERRVLSPTVHAVQMAWIRIRTEVTSVFGLWGVVGVE
ncbi:hypothetical protein BDZ45DRAFT_688887 [Acephala macrosclerotiorum]|nr:hypothetical protein BDZ45DRAFT_688887 [Acephala macrosclerotiorum]